MNEKWRRKIIDDFCEKYVETPGIPGARKELAELLNQTYYRGFHRC